MNITIYKQNNINFERYEHIYEINIDFLIYQISSHKSKLEGLCNCSLGMRKFDTFKTPIYLVLLCYLLFLNDHSSYRKMLSQAIISTTNFNVAFIFSFIL